MFASIETLFENFETEYKRFQYFEKTRFLIRPKSYLLGTTDVSKTVNDVVTIVPTEIYGQFISIEAVLKCFFEQPGVLKTVLNYMNKLYKEKNSNYQSNFIQGELWSEIKLNYEGKIVIPILINFYEYQTNNPLGSHTSAHKIAATYFSLLTLPP